MFSNIDIIRNQLKPLIRDFEEYERQCELYRTNGLKFAERISREWQDGNSTEREYAHAMTGHELGTQLRALMPQLEATAQGLDDKAQEEFFGKIGSILVNHLAESGFAILPENPRTGGS